MRPLYVLPAAVFFLLLTPLYSQTPSYYHYTSSDGLASSTVYDLLQDRNGFLWFATINGISRFDGKHFTTFGTKDGLNSNSIISLAEGKSGELFVGNYEKGVNIIRDGRIQKYCDTIDGRSFALSYLLPVPSDTTAQLLYAYRSWGNINSIRETPSSGVTGRAIPTAPAYITKLDILPNGGVIALTTTGVFNFQNDTLMKMRIAGLPETGFLCYAKGKDSSYLLGTKGMIYSIKNHSVIKKYPVRLAGNNDVCAMLRDRNDNIWFSIMNRGFYEIPDGSDNIIDIGSTMGLQNTLVNTYLEDNEGNIWISTFGKGVYCLNNLYVKSYSENDGLSSNNVYSIIEEKSGKLILGTFNGINILENGRFDHIRNNLDKMLTEYIYRIKEHNGVFYVCGTIGGNRTISFSYEGIRFHMFNEPSFCALSSGEYLFGTGWNSVILQKGSRYGSGPSSRLYIFGDSAAINRINDIYEDSEKNIWAATGYGLCKVTRTAGRPETAGWKKSFFLSNPVLHSRMNTIAEDGSGNIWFAGEKGIARYCVAADSMATYTTLGGHDLSSSTSIAFDAQKRIWIGTMKGLYLFDGTAVKILNRQTGLPTDEIFSLWFNRRKNLMSIGTSSGISLLDVHKFDNYRPAPPEVQIIGVKAGDSLYGSYQNLVFEPAQRHVSIDFRAVSFSSPGSIRYRYNVNGVWEETDHDFLNFLSLESGHYTLQIAAKSVNSDWGRPCTLSFDVKPRFTETIWYELGILLLFAAASVFVVAWRLRMNSKKVQEEAALTERINDLKHQALSAMMNPHFIFNALNSVQYLINSQRNEEANNYIAMMAKLIRKNLDTAGSGFILLSEEINRLTLYLELEKLRFQEGFSYEIITGAGIDTASLLIPNMIIQPFVENTLWHGILDSGKKGVLSVSFTLEEVDIDSVLSRSLIIKVTDNGIGITEAKKKKKEDHISKGIQIIEERLRLLSTRMQLPKPIMFEDLSSRDGNTQGTEVIISLPQPLYKIVAPESNPDSVSSPAN